MTGIRRAGVVEDAFAMVGITTVGVFVLGGLTSLGILAVKAAEAWFDRHYPQLGA